MGTAGFIIEAAKYIRTHQKDELLNVQNSKNLVMKCFMAVIMIIIWQELDI